MRDSEQFGVQLDAALHCAPEVHAPRHFRQRVMAGLPETPTKQNSPVWQFPLLAFGAGVVLVALVAIAFEVGAAGWLGRPVGLLSALAIETALAVWWLWRTVVSG